MSQSSQGEFLLAEPEGIKAMLCWPCSYTFSKPAVDRPFGYLTSGKDFSSSWERHWKTSKFSVRVKLDEMFRDWLNRF